MVSFLFILLETTLFLLLLPPSDIYAQVVINEFSSSDSSDWIELFNTSVGEIDLTSWSIKDTAASPVYDFSGNRLPAKESCYQDVSNRLNNSGDRIQLLSGVTEVDCVTYGTGNGSFCADAVEADITAPSTGETAARTPEGTGTWVIGFQTKSITSCESLISTPTPTPTLTPTLSPTPKPTSTPTPSPTPKPIPTPTPTNPPTVTPEVLGTAEQDEATPSDVDGDGEPTLEPADHQPTDERAEADEDEDEESPKGYSAYATPILIALSGLALLGASSFPLLKKRVLAMRGKKGKQNGNPQSDSEEI